MGLVWKGSIMIWLVESAGRCKCPVCTMKRWLHNVCSGEYVIRIGKIPSQMLFMTHGPSQIEVWFKYKIVFVVEHNWSLNRYVVSANNLFAVLGDYEMKSFFGFEDWKSLILSQGWIFLRIYAWTKVQSRHETIMALLSLGQLKILSKWYQNIFIPLDNNLFSAIRIPVL